MVGEDEALDFVAEELALVELLGDEELDMVVEEPALLEILEDEVLDFVVEELAVLELLEDAVLMGQEPPLSRFELPVQPHVSVNNFDCK